MLRRLHRWIRFRLWSIAITLTILFVLALIFGSWHKATDIWLWVSVAFLVGFFAWNIWGGWVEWRGRRNGQG